MFSVIPDLSGGAAAFAPASLSPILGQLDFSRVFSLDFLVVMFAFLFVDIFDTLGTLIGVSSKANMLDERGRLPRIKGALLADAVATTVGAVIGTSTTTTFVESATGVSEGGRTGLTAVCVAVLFALSLFLSPFFMAIPAFATAPALVIVGFLMLSPSPASTSTTSVNPSRHTSPSSLCPSATASPKASPSASSRMSSSTCSQANGKRFPSSCTAWPSSSS